MFEWNYEKVKHNIDAIEREILDLDTRYSTTKTILDSVRAIRDGVLELKLRYNTGVRTKGKWIIDEDGMTYCSCCQAPKIQTYDNFCGNCGADMGKL